MKTLYESILDDEDILTGNIKKNINNPFYFVSNLMGNMNLNNYKQDIKRMFNEVIKTLKPNHPIKVITDTDCVRITLNNDLIAFDPLIILRPGHLWSKNQDPYGFSGDQKLVVFFSETFIEEYIDYGFKDETDYMHWIKMISKKYNLKKSKKDVLVYYI